MTVMAAVKCRAGSISVAWLLLAVLAGAGGSQAAGGVSARLVLSRSDVGGHYLVNRAFTSRHTLSEVQTAAPRPVRRRFASLWVEGTQTGFNGDRSVAGRTIISIADVFRTTALRAISGWWEARYLTLSGGSKIAIPRGAPGSSRFLLRGHMQANGVLIYEWRHGRAILQTWLIGPPGTLRVAQLLKLVRAQDAKATHLLG